MRKALALLAGGVAVMAALALAFYWTLRLLAARGGFWAEAWRALFGNPFSFARVMVGATVLLVLAACFLTPIALLETRSLRAFARLENELRRDRPEDVITPYAGEEGEGVAFDGPSGRVLVLRAAWGIGQPRVVTLGRVDPAAVDAERPSPEGS